MEAWEFDALATLRRSGQPFELTAGQLLEALMITSGSVTNRIDRLEQRGLVKRTKSVGDRRFVRIGLTTTGLDLIDKSLSEHLANEARILQGLTAADIVRLERLLRKLQHMLSDGQASRAGRSAGLKPTKPRSRSGRRV